MRKSHPLSDLDADIRDHIERETQDNIDRGMPPEEARYAALRKFGNQIRVKEDARAAWIGVWLEQVLQDLAFGLRTLRRSPGFATLVVCTLALGIGTTTAAASIVYSILYRPLTFANSEQLVRIWEQHPGGTPASTERWLSNLTFYAWNSHNQTIGPIAAFGSASYTVGLDEPTRLDGAQLSPAAFDILGVKPTLGRFFTEDDARSGALPAVVISDGLWRQQFAADPTAIGRSLIIDQQPHMIVGVAPPSFTFPSPLTRLWKPMRLIHPTEDGESSRVVATQAIARLRPGANVAQAAAEGTAFARAVPRPPITQFFFGHGGPVEVQVRELVPDMTEKIRPSLMFFLLGVLCLLLIACANVASLLLARGNTRAHEFAVRASVGGGRLRLVRQLLTESLVLTLLGGVVGGLLAFVIVRLLPAVVPPDFPRLASVRVDGVALTLACAISLASGILAGVFPAFKGVPPRLDALYEGHRTSAGVQASTWRRAFVVVQFSLAVALVVTAALLGRSMVRLLSADAGYDPNRVLTATVYLPGASRGEAKTDEFLAALLPRLRATPGVQAAGAGNMMPFGLSTAATNLTIPMAGREPVTARVRVYTVTPGYAEALALHLRQGRFLDEADINSGTQALLVNEAFVRTFLHQTEPLGFHVGNILSRKAQARIVGVVANVLKDGPREIPLPEVYVAPAHGYGIRREINLLIRATTDPMELVSSVRQFAHDLEPAAAFDDIATMTALRAESIDQERLVTATATGFALIGALLATLGLYGVLSHGVSARRREIAVRSALGATRGRLACLIVGEGAQLSAFGLGAGLLISIALARVAETLLFGVALFDGPSLLVAIGVLTLITICASVLPAWHAVTIDPALTLRGD